MLRKPGYIILLIALASISCAPKEKYNVVLIVMDAVRADHLGCYGYQRDTSPAIDQLARQGVLFTQAFAQGPATRYSIASLFTSTYPSVHKICEFAAVLPDEFTTLAEVLKSRGYATAAFVPLTYLKRTFNMDQGFELYDDDSFLEEGELALDEQIFSWLKNASDRPFFAYLHYMGGHAPYSPPAPYDTMFWEGPVPEPMKEFVKEFFLARHKNPFAAGLRPDLEAARYMISQYDGEIRYTDERIKGFLQHLEDLKLSERTLVIVMADHGEGFSDHGKFFHETGLYDELIHVPLIMRLPKAIPPGRKIFSSVRIIDIMPTILDLLHIRNPPQAQGASLWPVIQGKSNADRDCYSEALQPGGARAYFKAVRTKAYKLIEMTYPERDSPGYELYDLKSDPKEQVNLIGLRPQIEDMLKKKLVFFDECNEKLNDTIGRDQFKEETAVVGEKGSEYLQSLGYAQ